jgi:hypothetical protein
MACQLQQHRPHSHLASVSSCHALPSRSQVTGTVVVMISLATVITVRTDVVSIMILFGLWAGVSGLHHVVFFQEQGVC